MALSSKPTTPKNAIPRVARPLDSPPLRACLSRGRFESASMRVPLSRETHEPIHGAWRRHPCRRHSRERGTRIEAPAGADPQGSAPRKPTACFLLPGVCGARDGGTKPMEGPCVSRKKEASRGRIKAAPREEGAQTKGESKRPSREPRADRSVSRAKKALDERQQRVFGLAGEGVPSGFGAAGNGKPTDGLRPVRAASIIGAPAP